ncbi:MAG: hypothetical protein WA125_16885 [Desulfosporosinus sp.]
MGNVLKESGVRNMDKRIAELEKVIVSQAKEIAALKGQASGQPREVAIRLDGDHANEFILDYLTNRGILREALPHK